MKASWNILCKHTLDKENTVLNIMICITLVLYSGGGCK